MEFPKHQVGPRQPFESSEEIFANKIATFMQDVESGIAVEIYHEAHGMAGATDEEKVAAEREYLGEHRPALQALLKDLPQQGAVLEAYDAYAKGESSIEETKAKMRELLVA